jgi:hypothetical protein
VRNPTDIIQNKKYLREYHSERKVEPEKDSPLVIFRGYHNLVHSREIMLKNRPIHSESLLSFPKVHPMRTVFIHANKERIILCF